MITRVGADTGDLYDQAVRHFRGVDADRRFLDAPGTVCLVATEEQQVTGWCWGYELPRPDGQLMMYLHELEVDAGHRRQGIGRSLLEELIRLGRDKGSTKLFLITEEDNRPARALYESCGGRLSEGTPTVTYWFGL